MEDVSIPLVSNEISEEEDKNDCSIIKLKNKTQKKKYLICVISTNATKFCRLSDQIQYLVTTF